MFIAKSINSIEIKIFITLFNRTEPKSPIRKSSRPMNR